LGFNSEFTPTFEAILVGVLKDVHCLLIVDEFLEWGNIELKRGTNPLLFFMANKKMI
jgi:hypothetical protein